MEQHRLPPDERNNNTTNWSGIDSSSVLFEKPVPVRIKSPSEDRQAELTIRILMGVSKQRRSTKVLQIQITNELDPFFLYSLEVNEEDFQSLKVEQCILVDFGTFPHKFIELLEYCIGAGPVEAPRFLTVLNVRTGDSTFSVVETNQFKHLSHLSLCFRQGNDSTIKSYLAGRLAEYKGANLNLHDKLRRTLESLENSLQEVRKLHNDLADAKDAHSRVTDELEARHARELALEKEKALQECMDIKERLEREKNEMESRLVHRAGLQERRVMELDMQVKELTSLRHSLEIKVAELKTKSELSDKELLDRQQECDTLRTKNKNLDKELQLSSKQLSDNLLRLATLEQEVQNKAEAIANMSSQIDSVNAQRAALESSLKDAQSAVQKAEEKAATGLADLSKCNQTIDKLQVELKGSKAKLKLKAQVTAQQETLLQERQTTIEKNVLEINGLKQEIASLKVELEASRKKAEELQKRSDEAQEELNSNHQMIQWLNQQLTEAQLGKYSKYTSASRALSFSSLSCNSSLSPKAPLLPSNTHNLLQHRPSTPASINSKFSSPKLSVTGALPGFMSKVAYKPPASLISGETQKQDETSSQRDVNRKVVSFEMTRNGLPKPQFSFASHPIRNSEAN